MVLAQMFCSKVHAAMSDMDTLSTSACQIARTSLLKVLEADLQTLEKQMDDGTSRKVPHELLLFHLLTANRLGSTSCL
jgi:hypothetical protein